MGFKPRRPRVTVYWRDPYVRQGWHEPRESSESAIECASTGFLLRQDKKQVEVALSMTKSGSVADVQVIPRPAVVRIERLK